MGVSTDAKLLFGYKIDEDSPDHEKCVLFMDEEYNKLLEAEKLTGCTIEYHCHSDNTMYFICDDDSGVIANRGNPELVNTETIQYTEHRGSIKSSLLLFAKTLGLSKPKGDPAWWLMSYWG
jgi:hypothetical protein